MARKTEAREDDVRALVAAHLATQHLSQTIIAEALARIFPQLPASQATVSRLLAYCRDRNWLVERIDWEKVGETDPSYRHLVEGRYSSAERLTKKMSKSAEFRDRCRIHVVGNKTEVFNRDAARVVRELIEKQSPTFLGVTWGGTLRAIIEELQRTGEAPASELARYAIPLCGEPVLLQTQAANLLDSSSSDLARLLEKWLRDLDGGPASTPNLLGVTAYISAGAFPASSGAAAKARAEAVKEFLTSIDACVQIFGDPRKRGKARLVDRLDMILTGVGIIAHDDRGNTRLERSGAFIRERLEQNKKPTISELDQHILGDLGGLLIPRKEKDATIEDLNKGWIGMTLKDYYDCNRRSAEAGTPGVVVCAQDAEKAAIVKWVVEHGYALQAIVSEDVAEGMDRL